MLETIEGSQVLDERSNIQDQEKQAFLGIKFAEITFFPRCAFVSFSGPLGVKICCLICAAVHILGFLHYQEPFPHEMLFCGLYGSYFLMSCYSFSFLYWNCCSINYLVESVVSAMGFVLFVVSAFVSMYHAEKDIHLQYLSDEEEWSHRFFVYCRLQSLAATFTAQIFLVHCCLSMDMADYLNSWFRSLSSSFSASENQPNNGYAKKFRINPFWISSWNAAKNCFANAFNNMATT